MRSEKVPYYYREGKAIEAKIERYRDAKEQVIANLHEVSHLISNIEGKLEELDKALKGDRKLEVTLLRGYYFYEYELGVAVEKEITLIVESIDRYNNYVKKEKFVDAKKVLLKLKTMMLKLQEKKAWAFGITNDEMEKKAHTPMVIRERKRKKDE